MAVKWAFCGGYEIDLFLGRETRKHGDIDVCVFERDRNVIKDYMLVCDWNVYEFRGMGRLRKLNAADASDAGRNLMCVKDGCRLVDFYPCDEPGMLLHVFHHTGMEKFDYIEFLFNDSDGDEFVFSKPLGIVRDIDKAILNDGRYYYLAPEIALLYKAANADDETYRRDYGLAVVDLDDDQRSWFRNGLKLCYPQGHPWL